MRVQILSRLGFSGFSWLQGTDLQRDDSVDVELQKLLLAFAAAPALAELSVLLPDHATMSCDSLVGVRVAYCFFLRLTSADIAKRLHEAMQVVP